MKTKKTKLGLNKTTVCKLDNLAMSHLLGGDCIPPLPENTYTYEKDSCSVDFTLPCIPEMAPTTWRTARACE